MKNKTFRFVSLLLSLSMVLGSFSMPAYAAQVDTDVVQEAVAFYESELEQKYVVEDDFDADINAEAEETVETTAENDSADDVVDEATEDESVDEIEAEEEIDVVEETTDDVSDEADVTDEAIDEIVDEAEEAEIEDFIAETEEIASEENTNALEVGSKINIKFVNMTNYSVLGADAEGNLEATIEEGGSVSFDIFPDEGYIINDIATNITTERIDGSTQIIHFMYAPSINNAFLKIGHYDLPSDGIKITVETIKSTKFDVQFYKVKFSDNNSTSLYYMDSDGEVYEVEPNENNHYMFEIPTGQTIRLWMESNQYNTDDFVFYMNNKAKLGKKITNDLTAVGNNMGILVTAEIKRVTNTKGNYQIRTVEGNWSDSINVPVTNSRDFGFYVKPKPGYYITGTEYVIGGESKKLEPFEEFDDGSYRLNVPYGFEESVNIIVSTKKKLNLANTTVSLYFDGSIKASKTVKYNAEKAKTEEGIVPAKVVVKDENGKTIKNDEENPFYKVSYENTKEAGTAYVVIEGLDARTKGKKVVPYTIKGIDMADTKKIKIEVIPPVAWNGNPYYVMRNAPEVKVTDISDPANPIELKGDFSDATSDSDYVIYPYGPCDDESYYPLPGKYTVSVVGVHGYTGCRNITYNLPKPSFNKASTNVIGDPDDDSFYGINIKQIDVQNYTGKAIKPQVSIKCWGVNLIEGKDYVIKKYGNNTNSYLAGPGDAGFSTKKAPYITIAGKGNYQGTKTIYFKIDKVDVNGSSIDVTVPVYKYTGKPVAAKPVVKMVVDGIAVKTLKENTDYTLEYENNTEASTSAIVKIVPTVKGCLKVTGEATCRVKTFTIANNSIADSAKVIITLNDAEGKPSTSTVAYDYTGYEIKPIVTVMREALVEDSDAPFNFVQLKEGVDYLVSYSNNVNVGSKKATVKITGIGDYYGSVTKKFTIKTKPLHADDLSNINMYIGGNKVSDESVISYDYTGYAIKPIVDIVDEKAMYLLKEGVDYTLSYSNNVNVSTEAKPATITVKFKGNYAGIKAEKTTSKSWRFNINSWNLDDSKVSISVNNEEKLVYTTKAIKPTVSVTTPDGRKVNPKVLKLGYANNVNAATATSEAAPTIKISPVNGYIKAPQVTAKASYVTKTFTIKRADLSKIINRIKIKDQVYKGKPIEPKLTIKFAGKTLKPDKDYEVEYSYNNGRGFGVIDIDFSESQNYTAPGGFGYVMFTIK